MSFALALAPWNITQELVYQTEATTETEHTPARTVTAQQTTMFDSLKIE